MTDLRDQVTVVTGASSGIGKAIALGLAARGATLCLVGRRLEALESVAETVSPDRRAVRCYQADLMVEKEIQELARRVRKDYGRLDMLIHSAGLISLGRLEFAPGEDFDRQYRINVRAPYILTQALLPLLRSQQGQIVFINSTAGLKATGNAGQYAATKHALKAVADSLRDEVNADGMRVLSLFLGRTATPMQASVHEVEARPYQPQRLIQPEDVAAVVVNALGLPRTAEVTDIHIRPLAKST